MKRFLLSASLFLLWRHSEGAIALKEIRTASRDVIVAFFRGTNTDVNATLISSPAQWTVNGQAALSLQRFVTQADQSDHHVYIQTAPLVEGTRYALTTPHGDTAFTFRARETFCEAIKTNQGAYSALATNNYAMFAIWLGTGGAKPITGALPAYEVFETLTGRQVATGTVTAAGSSQDASSGDYVYRIDLSAVREGGPYKVAVAGYGSSHPFGVGGMFSKRLAYTIFRGQYHQRCGCPLKAPYSRDIRATPCHTTVYDVDGPIGEANIVASGSEPVMKVYGGYHDAGDADRRAYHMSNPIINMLAYEAFPNLFVDRQFNIPDQFDSSFNITGSGNGMPDVLDEAEWGTLVWERLQNADGGIHFGTETSGYPSPFDAPMDRDTKRYGTVLVDNRATCVGAGLFMHLARLLKPYKAARSEDLKRRAELSFAKGSGAMANPEKLYYFIQKYLLDGDEAAHAQVRSLASSVDGYQNNTQQTPGYSLNNNQMDNPGYFYGYIAEKTRPTDSAVVARFKTAIKNAADRDIAQLRLRAYPVGNNPTGTAWGHNVRQPQYACASLLHWGLGGGQAYMNAAAELMNYILGMNPIGISYVTGIGFHQVHNPHDRESAYTKRMGWGPKPGITVFGPGVNPAGQVLPAIGTLPVERQFTDNMDAISLTEFTIFETMAHYAFYTVLSQGGIWDGVTDPYTTVGINRLALPASGGDLTLRMEGSRLRVRFAMPTSGHVYGGVYSLAGDRLLDIDLGWVARGQREFTVAPEGLTAARGGLRVLRLRGGLEQSKVFPLAP